MTFALVLNLHAISAGQNPIVLPPVPFEDVGACPFEGCVYREWVANAPITIRQDRRDSAPIAFRLHVGERISALTGVVVTIKPGRVRFRQAATLNSASDPISVAPGDTLYLLTYQGEGFTKAWFNGRVYTDVDVTDFVTGACDSERARCTGRLIERSKTQWWVRVRNQSGNEGWTREPQKFDGKDDLG
jgi:hypothetical protein